MSRRKNPSPSSANSKQPDPHCAKAKQYCLDIVSGRIPAGQHVKQACARQLSDLERTDWQYTFDENLGGRICRFIEALPHIKGPKAGRDIELEPWQCFKLTTTFGWVHKDTRKRRFRRAYLEEPRSNAKSTVSSGVGLYMVSADSEAGAEVYSAATTRDQARIIFADAQHMARKRPALCNDLGLEVLAHAVVQMSSASKFVALSSEGNTLDGLNIHCALIDELHAHKTRDVYDVIETGCGKRDQSLLWTITTAGSDRSGICYEIRSYLIKVLTGVVEDDSFFGCIWAADEADDWTQESTWIKANPNWGVSVQPEHIAQLAHKAMQMPAAQNNFKTKHLNLWVNADVAWMDMRAWDRCGDTSLDIVNFYGLACYIGLDLATKTDIAAKVRLFPIKQNGETHYYLFATYYLPEAAAQDGRNSQYSGWEIEGRLITTPGEVLDFERVRADLSEDSKRFQVREIPFDPWQATQLAQQMMQEGAPMVEYRNTVANFSAPMKEVDALVRSGRLHHDGDPVMAWMISNVVCHLDAKDNIYPRKERPENKIDGVIALITALGRAMHSEDDSSLFDQFISGVVAV